MTKKSYAKFKDFIAMQRLAVDSVEALNDLAKDLEKSASIKENAVKGGWQIVITYKQKDTLTAHRVWDTFACLGDKYEGGRQ